MKLNMVSDDVYCVYGMEKAKLASTFMRLQEFYESPNPCFAGHVFTRSKYLGWYKKNVKSSYFTDWGGFNIPSSVLTPFYYGSFHPLSAQEKKLLSLLKPIYASKDKFYVIGIFDMDAYEHEMAHAYYYLDYEYAKQAISIVLDSPPKSLRMVEEYLRDRHYSNGVMFDELQAYIGIDLDWLLESLRVSNLKPTCQRLRKLFDKTSILRNTIPYDKCS